MSEPSSEATAVSSETDNTPEKKPEELTEKAESDSGSDKTPTDSVQTAVPEAKAPVVEGSEKAPADSEGTPAISPELRTTSQIRISHILDEVLENPPPETPKNKLKIPIVLDLLLAGGLLVAVGGFTIGLFQMYMTHSAEQSIVQHNYKGAISILKSMPMPHLFNMSDADVNELLSRALYMDAMKKINEDNDLQAGLEELQQIGPGSRYFALAQEILQENYVPSETSLEGKAEVVETDPQPTASKSPIDDVLQE